MLEHPARAAFGPFSSGTGMRGLDDLDALARHAVAVAGDDEPGERAAPVLLERPRHRGRSLARADNDGAALGRRWQV